MSNFTILFLDVTPTSDTMQCFYTNQAIADKDWLSIINEPEGNIICRYIELLPITNNKNVKYHMRRIDSKMISTKTYQFIQLNGSDISIL